MAERPIPPAVRPAASRPARRLAVLIAVLAAALLVACSPGATPVPTVAPTSPAPTTSLASSASPAAAELPGARVAVDETLIRFLPATIAGFAIAYSAEATQEVLADPSLVRTATAVAYGLAVDSGTGDLVVAAVVRLKPGVFTDEFFRGWRTSYDKAACAPAGGVGGNAEAQLGGRTVYIGTCNGGARTYHTYLDKAGVVISATSVGTKRFGEQLVGNLRP
jgi:hypothetical protein